MAVVLVLMPAKGVRNWIWNRQCAGVSRFARARGWEARFEKIRADVTMAEIGKLVESTDPVGVVSRLPQALPKAVSGGRPVVYFDCEVPGLGRRTLRHDVVRTVHLAARELFSLPLRDFAFAAFPGGHEWCRAREKTFAQEVRARHGRLHPSLRPSVLREPLIRREIGKWLKVLPRPCGVFAANDLVAENVIRVCRKAGLRVPEDIAVVGVDDDPVRCPRSVPTITSVMPDWEGGAFLAMDSLARAVRRKAGPRGMEFRPLGLVRRGSTACEATRGVADIAKAIDTIRARATEGLTAGEVVSGMRCSRRLAEMRFREVTGSSILEEIRRVRLETAKAMLLRESFFLETVAQSCGWKSVSTFCHDFKRATGFTPDVWRRRG